MAMQFITLYCCMYTQICTFYAHHHGGRDKDDSVWSYILCYDIMISLCGIRWKVEEISSPYELWWLVVCVHLSHYACHCLSESMCQKSWKYDRYYNMREKYDKIFPYIMQIWNTNVKFIFAHSVCFMSLPIPSLMLKITTWTHTLIA